MLMHAPSFNNQCKTVSVVRIYVNTKVEVRIIIRILFDKRQLAEHDPVRPGDAGRLIVVLKAVLRADAKQHRQADENKDGRVLRIGAPRPRRRRRLQRNTLFPLFQQTSSPFSTSSKPAG